jgi:hypothetical protein
MRNEVHIRADRERSRRRPPTKVLSAFVRDAQAPTPAASRRAEEHALRPVLERALAEYLRRVRR